MWAQVNHWNIHYEVQGEGDPVLLLHGIPTSSFIWRRQIEALSGRFRVYAPDLLGWGSSDKPRDFDYTIRSYVECLHQFLAQVGLEKVVLGVHDLGGAIGLGFLGRSPEKVSRLIILDTFAYLPPVKYLLWAALYGLLYRLLVFGDPLNRLVWELAVRRTDTFVTLAFHDKSLVTRELVATYRTLNRDTRLTDLRVLSANGIAGLTGAVEHNSHNVRVPTLILWAENDVLFPPSAALRLHRNIPGSILKTIPECGHFLQEEKPEEVNRHILEFLANATDTESNGLPARHPVGETRVGGGG
ncbi:MAG: alpha/beta hydrolase [Chloroflexi bacterium]|nr:alpha/beta hydrolase [Chloroflexota bacterium]